MSPRKLKITSIPPKAVTFKGEAVGRLEAKVTPPSAQDATHCIIRFGSHFCPDDCCKLVRLADLGEVSRPTQNNQHSEVEFRGTSEEFGKLLDQAVPLSEMYPSAEITA